MAQALTILSVDAYAKRDARYEVPDGTVRGLRLVVQPSGAKSWCVRYSSHGRDRKHTLGPFPRVGLPAARKLASVALLAVAAGRDPAQEKTEARRRAQAGLADDPTFGETFDRYVTEHVRPNLKESSADELEGLFALHVLPTLKARKLRTVDATDVKRLTMALRKKGKRSTANKVFQQVRTLFNWCVREMILLVSPLAGQQKPEVETSRERVLTDGELGAVWGAAGAIGFPFGPIVRLIILTAQRREEVRSIIRSEVTFTDRIWIIPGARTKNGREHFVPLSPAALDLLRSLPVLDSPAGFFFTTNGETASGNFSNLKDRLDAAIEKSTGAALPHWTLHDLRRTAATRMGDLGVMPHVVEAILNHVSGSKRGVAGTYNRALYLPEKRAALELWAAHVTGLA